MGSRAEWRQECTRSTGSSLQAAGLPQLHILSAHPANTLDIMDPSQQKRLPLEILSIFRFLHLNIAKLKLLSTVCGTLKDSRSGNGPLDFGSKK